MTLTSHWQAPQKAPLSTYIELELPHCSTTYYIMLVNSKTDPLFFNIGTLVAH